MRAQVVVPGAAGGLVLASDEGLSFWGGVDPATGRVIDALHPLHGRSVAGAVLAIPTSRGSCTGSGVLLELVLAGHAPALLAFREGEDVLTLGALVAGRLFDRRLPVLRLDAEAFARLARAGRADFDGRALAIDGEPIQTAEAGHAALDLGADDVAMLAGRDGPAVQVAMEILCAMAAQQGATRLLDVTRAHIDGCIYASPANLTFAERMRAMGARVRVPTTMNAISVDLDNWRAQGTAPDLGRPAAALAKAYVDMGARPTFTCSPYQLPDPPQAGEALGWSESNAVIYANSVLGARSVKHPDFLDLCIALTGRAPLSGVYLDAARRARRVVRVTPPASLDDAFWPLLGHLVGRLSPDRIPLVEGLDALPATPDDLQALCAAFGTTSGAPMLHVAGHTPEAALPADPGADAVAIGAEDLRADWDALDGGADAVDLVAIGSPHVSLEGLRRLDALASGQGGRARVPVVVTCGRAVREAALADGVLGRLESWGARIVSDLCWCSISEPVLPPAARAVVTNSGKYAHYGPGLHGRTTRLASLADCVRAAATGVAPGRPGWLS